MCKIEDVIRYRRSYKFEGVECQTVNMLINAKGDQTVFRQECEGFYY